MQNESFITKKEAKSIVLKTKEELKQEIHNKIDKIIMDCQMGTEGFDHNLFFRKIVDLKNQMREEK